MKYYIATSLERKDAHNTVRDALNKLGHQISYDWTIHGSVKNTSVERLREVGYSMINAIKDSDFIVVLLPGGRGTHTELGASLAYNKPIFLHTFDSKFLQLGDDTCAFYFQNQVTSLKCSFDEFVNYIDYHLAKNLSKDTKIKKNVLSKKN